MLSACDSLLEVSDPGSIQSGQLEDPALENLLVNGAIGEFQFAYGYYALWSGVLADEVFTDHTNVSVREFSLHNFNDLNDITTGAYENIHRARQSADDASARLKAMLRAACGRFLRVSRESQRGAYA
jgi:hypothetical protein